MASPAKISLISLSRNLRAVGIRTISSYLKQHHYRADLIFLTVRHTPLAYRYSDAVVYDLVRLCQDSALIGFSLMSSDVVRVRDLTTRIKRELDVPILWGGVHPTVKPDECLEYANGICVGEGEDAILELVERLGSDDMTRIKNIWIRRGAAIIKNEIRALQNDLDVYPPQDYDIASHFLIDGDAIVPMTEEHLQASMPRGFSNGQHGTVYYTMTTRGCPNQCSFCVNNALRRIYLHKGPLVRKRSTRCVISEIEQITRRFGFITEIALNDDTFFARSVDEIEEFCDLYKKRIGLPMRCAVSPTTMNEAKLKPMIEAGLARIDMGVQTFCATTLRETYKRSGSLHTIRNAIELLDRYRSNVRSAGYDLLIDNPYESRGSVKATIEFVLALPDYAHIRLYPLTFYPGTELYERAKKDGLIRDEDQEINLKSWEIGLGRRYSYMTYMLVFASSLQNKQRKSAFLIYVVRMLMNDRLVRVLDNDLVTGAVALAVKTARAVRLRTRLRALFHRQARRAPSASSCS